MTTTRTHIDQSDAWKALEKHHRDTSETSLRDLFATDSDRADRLTIPTNGLIVDMSKHLITDQTLDLLVALAETAGVPETIEAMFTGEHINVTEDRAVLHTALRLPADAELEVDGQDIVTDVHAVLTHMAEFAERVRRGEWTGHTGKRIRTVVNIGIGGSDLGPLMAYQQLGSHLFKTTRFRTAGRLYTEYFRRRLTVLESGWKLSKIRVKKGEGMDELKIASKIKNIGFISTRIAGTDG